MDTVALYAELDAIKVEHESGGLPYYVVLLLCLRHAREAVPFSSGHDVIRELLSELIECTIDRVRLVPHGDSSTEEESVGLAVAGDVLYSFVRMGEIREEVEKWLEKFEL